MRLSSKLKMMFQPVGEVGDLSISVRDEGLTYLSDRKLARLERCLRQIEVKNIPGGVAEFGVALGGSAIVMASSAKAQGRPFLGFDVFDMIPPPTSEKDDEKSKERYKVIAAGQSKGIRGATYYGYMDDLYGTVCASFARHDVPVDGDNVQLVKGLFEDTVPQTDLGDLAFCHIDCDWHDPVAYCLDIVAERLSVGGMILLDDYHDYGGCQIAVDAFCKARKDFVFRDGRNVILERRR